MDAIRTLIVAERSEAQEILHRILASGRRAGARTTSDTADLVEELGAATWDLVVLQAGRPGLPVVAAVEVVRRADPEVPIVVLGEEEPEAARIPGVIVLPGDVGPERLAAVLEVEIGTAPRSHGAGDASARLDLRERALDAATNGVAIGDASRPGFPLVYVNAAFEHLTGYRADQILGRSCRVLQGEQTDPAVVARLADALRDGRPVRETLLNVRADGSTFFNDVTLSPVHDADHEVTHVIGVLSDVTERVRATHRLGAAEIRYSRVIEDLAAAELRYRELVEQIPAVVYIADYDVAASLRYLSPQICELLGSPPEAFLAEPGLWYEHVHPDDRERVLAEEARTFHAEEVFDCEYRMVHADGRVHWVWERDTIVRTDGRPLFTQGVIVDITAQRQAEDAVREERDRAQRYLDLAGMIVVVLDAEGRIGLLNAAGYALLGHAEGELLGRNWYDVCAPPEMREQGLETFRRVMTGDRAPGPSESEVVTASGARRIVAFNNTLLRDEDGVVTGSLSSGVDMTERREAEQQIAYLAYHDSLTGLPNRALLREHLELSLARARRTETSVALLYLDLDDFKLVNDSLGHGAGDELLCRVAMELRARSRATDLLARHGGDEFLLLLADLTDPVASAETAAAQVQGAFAEPFEIGGTEFHIGASIGISLFPDDAQDAEALLAHADAAMYEAKGAGRNEIRRFRDDIAPGIDRLSFTTRLRRAMAGDELELHWQPIVDIESGLIAGLEALVRWQDPGRGLVLPAEFVPFAEETGLIDPLGEWVADGFCKQRKAWQAMGLDPYAGFNVSPRELRRPDFAERLLQRLNADGLGMDHVTIEITEAAVLGGDPQGRMAIDKLSEAGVTLVLDDFGVAYSSLSRLRDVPARWIKIDRSFLASAPEDPQATAILGAMVGLVGAVGLDLIVEGVERTAQRELLSALGVSKAQGFLLGRPAPAPALEARLRESPVCWLQPTSPSTSADLSPASSRTGAPERS